MAEAHPVGFRWVMKARERGAKLIHVDPRFRRTSAMADMHVPIRAGTRHRLPRRADPPRARDRVVLQGVRRRATRTRRRSSTRTSRTPRTSAAASAASTPRPATYDPQTWRYEGGEVAAAGRPARAPDAGVRASSTGAGMHDGRGQARRDARSTRAACSTSCKRHFARYTPEMVERSLRHLAGGLPRSVAEALIANSGRERTTALCYAVGWTQHTAGVQMIRAGGDPAAAARQHRAARAAASWRCAGTRRSRARPTSRRSTTCCRATCTCRRAREGELDLEDLRRHAAAPTRGWWSNFDKYIVSLLKAWFGDAATRRERLRLRHLPKITGNHSHFPTMLRALDGGLDGLFLMGQNPAVGSQHAGLQRRALAHAQVARRARPRRDRVRDLLARRARGASRRAAHGGHPDRGLPDAGRLPRREGRARSRTRSGSLQWRDKALDPPGDARSELWFMHHLFKRVQRALRRLRARRATGRSSTSSGTTPSTARTREPDAEDGAQGDQRLRRSRRASPCPASRELKDDGSTACGCWIYSGVLRRRRQPGPPPRPGRPRRRPAAGSRPSGAGRGRPTAASSTTARRADPEGKPWSERKKLRLVGRGEGKWTGYDVPDFPVDKPPGLPRRPTTRRAWTRSPATDPFIMMADGTRLAVLAQRPARRPDADALRAARVAGRRTCSTRRSQANPAALRWTRPENPYAPRRRPALPARGHDLPADRAPHRGRRCRRWLPWLAELQPEMFAEIDPVLAARARDRGRRLDDDRHRARARSRRAPR